MTDMNDRSPMTAPIALCDDVRDSLRRLLRQSHMSQHELARRLGCNPSNAFTFVSGANLTLRTLATIADVCGATVQVTFIRKESQ